MTITRHVRMLRVAIFLIMFVVPSGWVSPAFAQGKIRADFDGDGLGDLAIGVPGENGSSAGSMSSMGPTPGSRRPGISSSVGRVVPRSPEPNDNCGAAVAAATSMAMGSVTWRWDVRVRMSARPPTWEESTSCMVR